MDNAYVLVSQYIMSLIGVILALGVLVGLMLILVALVRGR